MSVSGLCDLCERPGADNGCDRCGRLVCDRHFDDEAGFCVDCASELGEPPGGVDPEDLPDGVDTYQF